MSLAVTRIKQERRPRGILRNYIKEVAAKPSVEPKSSNRIASDTITKKDFNTFR